MSGYFVIHRGLFDHVDFAPEPFTEREAWMWLISEAAWKPRLVRVGSASGTVMLERGQLAHSQRYLAEKWQWSLKKVRGYLDRSEKQGRLSRKRAHDGAVITICNYDKFQLAGRTEGQTEGAPRADEGRKEEEVKKVIQEIDRAPGDAIEIHREFLKVARSDVDDQRLWGSIHQIEGLLSRGFPRQTILAGAARAMQGRSQAPPWSYFAKCIESENEQRSSPAKMEIAREATENLVQTAKRLSGEVITLGPRPSIYGGTENSNPVRVLSDRTGERP